MIIKTIIMFITTLLGLLEYGTLKVKLLSSFMLAAIISPIPMLISELQSYITVDTRFAALIFWLIIADLAIGIWKHLKLGDFDFKQMFYGLITKVVISYVAMMIFNGFGNIQGLHDLTVKVYILLVGKLANFFYVAGSTFNNMYVVTSGRFPPIGWMKKMKKFNDTLDVDIFKKDVPQEIIEKIEEEEKEASNNLINNQ